MNEDELKSEVERLRAEVESYRQRELADLKDSLATMTRERDHYRSEAQRNADVGREIASAAQEQVAELRGKLAVREQVNARTIRKP